VAIQTSSEVPAWFAGLSGARLVSGTPGEVTAVCYDSRDVVSGAAFVAIPGGAYDGHAFIPQALAAGASAVIVQEDRRPTWRAQAREKTTFVSVPDTRVALAEAAAAFHRYPARSLCVIGVTGTDGKTTTSHLIAHVFNATGHPAGYLTSVEFGLPESAELNSSHMTTVESADIQRHLVAVRDAGGVYVVLEASSIGLDMHRVDHCEFDVGVFTNLAPDHLDYHGNMLAYHRAKALLFRMLGQSIPKGFPKAAVLNADDPASEAFAAVTSVDVMTYGMRSTAAITASDPAQDGFGMRFRLRAGGAEIDARVPLLGEYNVLNSLAAVSVAISQGVTPRRAAQALESFPGVPGRMERIDEGQPFQVVVDIASTEQAMRNVLRVLRPLTRGRLIVVFGAAGERDVARRSGLAHAVAETADYAVITNEDPRHEDPEGILDDIAAAIEGLGCKQGQHYEREIGRREAIALAFDKARPGDTVLLAGKATEPSIVVGETHWPWDERGTARELLGAQGGV
jgi:UDP-N-acetylmuramoyl-L-alanyl-D-glutamate--2,6-diaminopimelate ligase